MAFTNPGIVKYFNKIKPPYNISTVNQRAALKMLASRGKNLKQINKIKHHREKLRVKLLELKITERIFPADANFLLVKVTDATDVYNSLVEKNIIVRNRTSVVNNCLRITVGKPSENKVLIKALKSLKL